MAQQASEQQWSDFMHNFCVGCRKMELQKLAQFDSRDISEPGSKVLLGHMAEDPDATQNKQSISKCWLCSLRYFRFAQSAPECWVCFTDIMSTEMGAYQLHSRDPSRPGTIPCLCLITHKEELPVAWAIRNDAPDDFVIHKPVTRFLDISFVQDCITFCKDNHGTVCNEASRYVRGMKLFDCDTTSIVQLTSPVAYVALSYVWATKRAGDVEKRTGGPLRFEMLSQTIQDSITTTTRLGYRYLWVDKLCIDQTNEAEKQDQVMQMDKIYAGAELTIVAAAGDNEEFGLPGVTSRQRTYPKAKEVVEFGSIQLVPFSLEHNTECFRSKWNTRGWTLQEGILSKRRLFFTQTQATFECTECTVPESLHLSNPPQATGVVGDVSRVHFVSLDTMLPNEKTDLQYPRLVSNFSSRSISNEEDSFSAFAGIAVYFSEREPPIFNFHGIPIQFENEHGELSLDIALARGLGWYHTSTQPANLIKLGAP